MAEFDFITIKRFLAKIKLDNTNCWIWTGSKYFKGYGHIRVHGKLLHAHRVSYEIFREPISRGLVIDHLCRNSQCVNPEHLEAVSNRENILRGINFCAKEARQTHCKNNHEFIPENTRIIKTPWGTGRQCIICNRQWQRNKYKPKAKKTHCKRGHELTEPNLVSLSNRHSRQCRKCNALRTRTHRNKMRLMQHD